MAAGAAPAARIRSMDSRLAVPSEITSSTMTTRPGERRADDAAALAVILGLLAIEGVGHVAAVLLGASAMTVAVASGMPL